MAIVNKLLFFGHFLVNLAKLWVLTVLRLFFRIPGIEGIQLWRKIRYTDLSSTESESICWVKPGPQFWCTAASTICLSARTSQTLHMTLRKLQIQLLSVFEDLCLFPGTIDLQCVLWLFNFNEFCSLYLRLCWWCARFYSHRNCNWKATPCNRKIINI